MDKAAREARVLKGSFEISSDRSRIDPAIVTEFLSGTYWAMGRTQAEVENTIAGSVCFGGYVESRLVAFGRIFEKPVGTAFLADVFVLPPWRGLGYGRAIVEAMVAYIDAAGYPLAQLNTRDAVGLYEKFGFALTGATPTSMKRERPRAARPSTAAEHGR
jgi:GNAT superfamily N-acetyltransferase